MKSIHFTNAYHPTSGGIRTWYRQVMDFAGDAGWQMRLVVPGERSAVEDVNAHARIYHVRAPRSPVFDRRYRVILPHRYLLPGGEVRRILRAEQPDIVEIADKYALNWLGGLLRKQYIPGVGRPVVVGFSFERMDDNVAAYLGGGDTLRRLTRVYMRWCYDAMLDAHLAASTYVAEELQAVARRRDAWRFRVQAMGIDSKRFLHARRAASLRGDLLRLTGGGPDTTLLLYVGRMSPEKNVELLVQLLAQLAAAPDDYRLVLAGDGPLREQLLRAGADAAAGRMAWHGQVQDRDALATLYASCDVFVHPNPREPFGIAPLEAMAAGCPVVLPECGGVLTYATPENAWLARPEGAAFAAAVRGVREDPVLAARRVAQGRETAARYDARLMAHAVFATYGELCREFTGQQEALSAQAASSR